MKLDTQALRYLSPEDWRVLTAVEMGSKNHELVPTPMIVKLSGLRGGSGAHRCISTLAKANLIARVKNAKYDGYRLTYGGLDYLALHTHQKRQTLYSTGQQIGTGKESDIHITASPTGIQHALKIHRLGRISFRSVKNNRDYLRHRSSASWMYMSRLAAIKEYAFMTVLHENGFPVPRPVAQSRHTLVMELIEGLPLRQVQEIPRPEQLYAELMDLVLALAGVGLIHGDFNEFNILIRREDLPLVDKELLEESLRAPQLLSTKLTPILIDFPQMLSIDHPNAEMYFDRDVACIKRFFERRFHFTSDEPGPFFADARKLASTAVAGGGCKTRAKRNKNGGKHTATRGEEEKGIPQRRLDVEVEASGFSKKMAKELEKYMQEVGMDGEGNGEDYGGIEAGGGNKDGNENEGDRSNFDISANEESAEVGEADDDLSVEDEGLHKAQANNLHNQATQLSVK